MCALAEHLSQSEIELPLRNTCYYSPLAEVGVSTQTEMNTPFTCEAIFSDIDGTFLTSEHHVSPKTQEVIRSAIQHGIQFSLISARNPLCIQPILDRIHLSCNIIGCNGALIMNENHKTDCNRTHSGIR
ncbi:HAD family hydrolase [Eubacterium ramulus]